MNKLREWIFGDWEVVAGAEYYTIDHSFGMEHQKNHYLTVSYSKSRNKLRVKVSKSRHPFAVEIRSWVGFANICLRDGDDPAKVVVDIIELLKP